MYYDRDLPPGSRRDKHSGALLFPVHPRELERYKKEQELGKELEEIKELKKELQDYLKDSKKE